MIRRRETAGSGTSLLLSDARAIALAGIRAADPTIAVREWFRRPAAQRFLSGAGKAVPTVHILAIGKAARPMAQEAARALGSRCAGGIAVVRPGAAFIEPGLTVLEGEHPVPGAGSFRAGRRALEFVHGLGAADRLLFLVSGGGSALLEHPAADLRASDLRRTTRLLLRSGGPIQSMNAIRRHLSAVKGGRLAQATRAGAWATLAISDVVGDAAWEIASGPTVPDPTTFRDAWTAAGRAGIRPLLPTAVRHHLAEGAAGRRPETAKPDNGRVARAPFFLVATNRVAIIGSAREARRRGIATTVLSSQVTGETRDAGRALGKLLRRAAARGPRGRGLGLLSGGETTVRIEGRGGHGGRNQEFVLSAAAMIAGIPGIILLSVGTDGVDGPTDAAGGWVDGDTLERARSRGVDVDSALRRHDAYPALARLGQLIRTGPTDTNVMDLHVALAVRRRQSG